MSALMLSDHQRAKPSRAWDPPSVDMKQVASVILGGGEGTRLYPLTLTRCKPAINFGGKYRLIDVPISNAIHADCYKIFVLTQFLSSSLHHHIFQTYMQGARATAPIEILTAEQKPAHKAWFQGTADAVRQNIDYLLESPVDYFLILSGDQLYNINFRDMVFFAQSIDADVVVAALPVHSQDAARMGILKVDARSFITDFHEKPAEPALLHRLRSPYEVMARAGILEAETRPYLGSMGIYLFKRKALVDLLTADPREDFGKHLIPTQVEKGRIAAFLYEGYWEDIGTIDSFYRANMTLTDPKPPFTFHHESRPIFTYRYDLPPVKFLDAQITHALLCDGAIVEAAEITNSILGPRTVVRKGTVIRDSYLMGNDYYESAVRDLHHVPPAPHIGENCILQRTIVDKNATIGQGVQLINRQQLDRYNGDELFIRDGIIVVPRGATIPDGFVL